MGMVYIRDAMGSVDEVGMRLEAAIKGRKFGILGMIDLQGKMKEKRVDLKNACRIYEVCNPHRAKAVLEKEMSIATALPCRIVVYEESGQVKIATMRPNAVLQLFDAPAVLDVADEVTRDILAMVDEAAS